MSDERRWSFMTPTTALNFTGERFTTSMTGQIDHEHRHRYLVAAGYCAGKRVLDVASGEGYGSSLLASIADDVVGVDVDTAAIEHARQNYKQDNLRFVAGSASDLPLGDGSVDVVVSFETVEHFLEHEAFMGEIRRVLAPGGLLIMSSPVKGVYSESNENHFHLRELTRDEFGDYVSSSFAHARFFEQKALMGSVIAAEAPMTGGALAHQRLDQQTFREKGSALIQSPYVIAIASDAPLPESFDFAVLDDAEYVMRLGRIVSYNEYLLSEKTHAVEALAAELERAEAEREQLVQDLRFLNDARIVEVARAEAHAAAVCRSLLHADLQLRQKAQLETELGHKDALLDAIYRSTSWRLTRPLRGVARVMRSVRLVALSATGYVRSRGLANSVRALMDIGRWRRLILPERYGPGNSARAPRLPETTPPATLSLPAACPAGRLAPHIVIVAELSIAQCAKYRVWQKKYQIEGLGAACTVVEWWRKDDVRDALQTATGAIFYRTPGYPELLGLIAEARRLNIPTFWEVDDLIFNAEAYLTNGNLDRLSPQLRTEVLAGVPLFAAALKACEYGLASTTALAEEMQATGVKAAFVVENALDQETIAVAEQVFSERSQRRQGREGITVVYGSGSKAHNKDFDEAAGALAKLLAMRPNVTLDIVGDLDLPASLNGFEARIQRRGFAPFADYLRILGECDINIAPLEPSRFNNAKSNIKYLEAAILGIPSVCSPRAAFVGAIDHGVTGYLAEGEDAWLEALLALTDDVGLRRRVGLQSREAVLADYAPARIAARQVSPALTQTGALQKPADALRVLQTNLFFAPQSFGGATIVAEQVSERLATAHGVEVFVCASSPGALPDGALMRHEARGLTCFGVGLPRAPQRSQDFRNPDIQRSFARILAATQPNIVHLHCIQGLSASIALACQDADIPYVVTLHDAWWLCERQFMVKADGKHCFNAVVTPDVCATCVPDAAFNRERSVYLREILLKAELILTPSEFHRALHVASGFPGDKVVVNRNGVLKPAQAVARPISGHLRFGFVGGAGPVKGGALVVKALNELPHKNYTLTVVDNTENLGFSSINPEDWKTPGTLQVVPAYSHKSMDAFFRAIDVLLFPTQCKESFGLTVREALSRNVWVIATDAGGAVEDIINGVNGVILPLTPDGDHAPLREALRELLDAPEKLNRFVNPNTDAITSFDDQTAELFKILLDVRARSEKKKLLQCSAA